jgi:hypothetical protein
MLKKYIDFITESHDLITESQLIELLLESDVMFSDNFKKVLGKIDSPVAKKILDLEKKDLPVVANYFDIDPKRNDYLYFTPDRKAQEILNDPKELYRFVGNNGGWLTHGEANNAIFARLGYVPQGDVYRPMSTEVGEVVEQIVSEKSGKTWVWLKFQNGQGVFNLEKLRPVDDRHKLVWSKNRQDVRVGRSMNALLTLAAKEDDAAKFTAREVEIFVNLYKAQMDKFNDKFSFFDVVQGGEIYDRYQYGNYYDASGTLANSCMAEADSSWLEPYTENKTVSLVIYKSQDDDSKIIGRAILWECLDGKKVMDRVYTNSDSDVELFRQFAQDSGWWYKSNNNSSYTINAVGPEGQSIDRLVVQVQLQKRHENFPYMDTLKFYSPETGIISNENPESGVVYYCESTEGYYDTLCSTCEQEGTITCPTCDGDGEEVCIECNGDGEVETDGESTECPTCDGRGNQTCSQCDGDDQITCPDCEGDF